MSSEVELAKSDEELQAALFALLTERVKGNPYSHDGEIAASLKLLPIGLQAMGATHHLDLSLTLDSITWHFGNFGEPNFVELTEQGLRELGLMDLAECFCEARAFIVPLLPRLQAAESRGEFLSAEGLRERADAIDRRGWDLSEDSAGQSAIYAAWLRYARANPENVFV